MLKLLYSYPCTGWFNNYRDIRKEQDMEQFEENLYVVDLGNINTAPEIIFELSSILDNEEAKNKRICLKLGNIDLNQAQLLSIKSLVNSIESTLSSIDTKSVETEKVALSLGIIVSNISAENSIDVTPEMTYKTAEEFKEAQENTIEEKTEKTEHEIIEQIEVQEEVDKEPQMEQEVVSNECITQEQPDEEKKEEPKEVFDELDAIFSSSPAQNTFLEMEATQSLYEEREALTDIIVPEQEYTKEDIELESFSTKYIKQTIRSGQVINYEGNVVIVGDCHPGCEITALGDITVWGVLSGIAHAGAGGNQKARIRALKMNAIQLRIANCYSRRPDSIETIFAEKTNSFTPEEARIVNNEIVVFKIND